MQLEVYLVNYEIFKKINHTNSFYFKINITFKAGILNKKKKYLEQTQDFTWFLSKDKLPTYLAIHSYKSQF